MSPIKFIVMILVAASFYAGCSEFQLASQKKTMIVDKISEDTFQVNFCGNAFMSQEEAERKALISASEEAISKGYNYFVVLEKKDDSEICVLDEKDKGRLSAGDAEPPKDPVRESAPNIRPNITLTIKCFSEWEKLPEGEVIDAGQFLNQNTPI